MQSFVEEDKLGENVDEMHGVMKRFFHDLFEKVSIVTYFGLEASIKEVKFDWVGEGETSANFDGIFALDICGFGMRFLFWELIGVSQVL